MSLSQDPAFSVLKDNFVCGVKDITYEPYAGISGRHEVDGTAINTTDGAGPHNLQMFVCSPDGVVLTCLPGFWNPKDLVTELEFATRLEKVWEDPSLSRAQKNQMFSQMHLAHIQEHSPQMVRRSKMQGFDQKYEAKHRLNSSDCIRDPRMVGNPNAKMLPQEAFKTTDEIMHQRMARRPFVPYQYFDVAQYVDYGRPKYDKHEDQRNADGQVNKVAAKHEQMIGNPQALQQNQQQQGGAAGPIGRRGVGALLRFGLSAALR